MANKRIILASASPRRKELLAKIIKKFKIVPSKIDESKIKAKSPEVLALKTALAKAQEIAIKANNAIVIGADTIVVLGKRIIGKPKNKKDAVRILKSLSGKTHKVITGLAVIDTAKQRANTTYVVTKVKMKKVKAKNILDYVASGRPLDKAGGYGIQEIEEVFIDRIDGDYDNVVGLPALTLKKLIRKLS
ncbi:MAG: Maf family protein [Candidatus Margulisbacteria bacterium]|nr:Maf family protein [Candidatus Margulisiibacteriota bacterium]